MSLVKLWKLVKKVLKKLKKNKDKFNYARGLLALGEIYLARSVDETTYNKFLKNLKDVSSEMDSDISIAYYHYFYARRLIVNNKLADFSKSYKELEKRLKKLDNREIHIQSMLLLLEYHIITNKLDKANIINQNINELLKKSEFFYLRLESIYQTALLKFSEGNLKEAQQIIESQISFAKMRNYKLFLRKAISLDIKLKDDLNISTDIDKINLKRLEKDLLSLK